MTSIRPPPPRRFRLLDAMILTAAVAAALALQRWTWHEFEERGGWESIPFTAGPVIAPPAWACVALVLFVMYQAAWIVIPILPSILTAGARSDPEDLRILIGIPLLYNPWGAGLAVAAAWTPPAFGGRRRAEPTWMDRAGRLLGGYALVCVPLAWAQGW